MKRKDFEDICQRSYRVQGYHALTRGEPLRGKRYETLQEAIRHAEIQANNKTNLDGDNPLIVWKAVAVSGVPLPEERPSVITYELEDEIPEEDHA